MSKISPKKRSFKIRQRKRKRLKLRKLRKSYSNAKTELERQKILDKAFRIAPFLTKKEFLAPLERQKKQNE